MLKVLKIGLGNSLTPWTYNSINFSFFNQFNNSLIAIEWPLTVGALISLHTSLREEVFLVVSFARRVMAQDPK